MGEIENSIRSALTEEQRQLLESASVDPGVFSEIFASFRGRRGPWCLVAFCWAFIFFLLAVYCAYRFFNTEVISEQILWSVAFLTGGMCTGLIKMWFWMEMNRLAIRRDLRRLELLLALRTETK